jgi:hypothetical protein
MVIELPDDAPDPFASRLRNARLAVDHGGDGLKGDLRRLGDISHGSAFAGGLHPCSGKADAKVNLHMNVHVSPARLPRQSFSCRQRPSIQDRRLRLNRRTARAVILLS